MRIRLNFAALSILLVVSGILARDTVYLYPGNPFRDSVQAYPESTTFIVKEGTHYQPRIWPKTGDHFIGEDGAVMDGGDTAYHAIVGNQTVDDIVIRNIRFLNYGSAPRLCVITARADAYNGARWTIENCEFGYCNGGAIMIGDSFEVRGNYIHHMGQIGLLGGATGSLVENNEIAFCNYEMENSFIFEAGGAKFAYATNLIVRGNYVHDNFGPGLWTDIDNMNILYEGNIIEDNLQFGIFHEISYDAVIRCNVIRNNGAAHDSLVWWMKPGQIKIANSQNTEICHNIIEVHPSFGDGIALSNAVRGEDWYCRDNSVHHNHIIHKGKNASYSGINGVESEWHEEFENLYTQADNRFDANYYHVPDDTTRYWFWRGTRWDHTGNGFRTFEEFQAMGQEQHGIIDHDTGGSYACAPCQDLVDRIETARKICPGRIAQQGLRVGATARDGNCVVKITGNCAPPVEICIHDARGRRVSRILVGHEVQRIVVPTSSLGRGMYLVRAHASGMTAVTTFVVR
ncbi:MAG: hypothetical protein GF418_13475 [Chitinivibrionales bacterium]|nr:hypothetical protein [Chitinivibrionales bacterium]MBD3396630.1 hypothetical protein [Chitinivibrionales bacterium]